LLFIPHSLIKLNAPHVMQSPSIGTVRV
jgi:hypothetical protein